MPERNINNSASFSQMADRVRGQIDRSKCDSMHTEERARLYSQLFILLSESRENCTTCGHFVPKNTVFGGVSLQCEARLSPTNFAYSLIKDIDFCQPTEVANVQFQNRLETRSILCEQHT